MMNRRRLRWGVRVFPAVLIGAWVVGCTENFGTPPVIPGSTVPVASESFAGPVVPRTILHVRARGGVIWIGTDKGLYRVAAGPGDLEWGPGHPGFQEEDGRLGVVRVHEVSFDPTGAVGLLVGGTQRSVLSLTTDAGATFGWIPVPNQLLGGVDQILAVAPTAAYPRGVLLAWQGLTLSAFDPAAATWTTSQLPATPSRVGVMGTSDQGRVAVAVEAAGQWTLWRSDDAGMSFQTTGLDQPESPLAVLPLAGAVAVATSTGVTSPAADLPAAGGEVFSSVSLAWRGMARVAAVVGTPGGAVVRFGTLGGVVSERPAPPAVTPATLSAGSGEAWMADATSGLWRLDAGSAVRHPFDGAALDWSAIAVDPHQVGSIYLGERTGRAEVWYGDPSDDMENLNSPFVASEVRTLWPDLGTPAGVFAGCHGAQFKATHNDSPDWVERNNGQFSYLQEQFSGPVRVRVIRGEPDAPQRLWLGSIDNDGPYRSDDGGLNWQPIHLGLGTPNSGGEDGLPAVSQVHDFEFVDDEVWMAGFRGGVWRWDEANTIWRQQNRGLSDSFGATVDTCCYEPMTVAVDVRDLAQSDGALLAATSWGVFRDASRTGQWKPSSAGLTNADVYALAVHPDRNEWIVAVSRGTATNRDWIFLSRDTGLTWQPVATSLRGKFGERVVWSDPAAGEVVALLVGNGAWRMELRP